jgi:hypothetical protein
LIQSPTWHAMNIGGMPAVKGLPPRPLPSETCRAHGTVICETDRYPGTFRAAIHDDT